MIFSKQNFQVLRLPSLRFGHTIYAYLELSSTQDKAKELSRTNAGEGIIICAKTQTNGRGRGDKTWISEPGGLYISIIYCPKQPIIEVSDFTKRLALFTKQAIERLVMPFHPINLEVKGINDLYMNGKKLVGIIVETETYGITKSTEFNRINSYIIGIGVNVLQQYFPDELKKTATSLLIETKYRLSRFEILKEICRELSRNLY